MDFLSSIFVEKAVDTILDIGSGSQPYRSIAEQIGFKYTGHDFAKYTIEDSNDFFGLHNSEAPEVSPELICDAMEIPENSKFDVILCTDDWLPLSRWHQFRCVFVLSRWRKEQPGEGLPPHH